MSSPLQLSPTSIARWLRHYTTLLLALSVVLAVSAAAIAIEPIIASTVISQGKGPGPNPGPAGPVNPSVPLPAESATSCGAWSSEANPIGHQITAKYGEIRNCLAVDSIRSRWIVTTLGTANSHGVIGVYRCTSEQCRDGRVDHPIAGWTFYPAPYSGGVSVLSVQSSTLLVVDNGGHQLTFDLDTGLFRS